MVVIMFVMVAMVVVAVVVDKIVQKCRCMYIVTTSTSVTHTRIQEVDEMSPNVLVYRLLIEHYPHINLAHIPLPCTQNHRKV